MVLLPMIKRVTLDRILVIYPGTRRYEIGDRIEAVPFEEVVRGDAKSLLYK